MCFLCEEVHQFLLSAKSILTGGLGEHVVEEAVMGAVVICWGDEGRRRDPTLFLTHAQMARAVMKSPGRGIHLHGGVCPEGPPP